MKKIKVGFILELSESWLGGVNYFKNLLSIIDEYEEFDIEAVVFIAKGTDKRLLNGYPKIEVIESDLLKRFHFKWFFRKGFCKVLKRDICLEKLLQNYKVDVVSHVMADLKIKSIPTIAWIPDFQHIYLPDLFLQKDIENRNNLYKKLAQNASVIILSSYDAQKDFQKKFPKNAEKSKVLQFVVPVEFLNVNRDVLKEKYKLKDQFFFLPNQFWQHKNHKVVLEALIILKKRNVNIQIVCSGNTDDFRNRQYFDSLLNFVEINELENNFLILGKIPYDDVRALSQECIALINPSLFEGWSTIVEEAKSMGKIIVLSDLEVHKEQNPLKGVFFERNNPEKLAQILENLWNESDERSELKMIDCNRIDFAERKKNQARTYREIIELSLRKV